MGTEHGTVGPYELVEELGRGGQGTVFLAVDTRLGRRVALKVIDVLGSVPEERLARFRREAEAASKLDHAHICAIHEAGDADGVPYIAMRYVEGETLAQAIGRRRAFGDAPEGRSSVIDPSSREGILRTVALVEKVARALHHSHERGLIHRDVKPGNVMVTPEGEPVILDFGLAREALVEDEQALTNTGDLLGTPAYMSPEQLMAQRIPLDRRTDVYSLGATLYECLTLRRPFEAPTRAQLYQRILGDEPSSASAHNARVPRDLRVVLETALEKNRDRRYQTALDLAEDLRRVRAFEPIRARPIGRLLRLRRWAQRHPALTSSGIVLVIAFAATIVLLGRTRASLRRSEMLRLVGDSAAVGQHDPIIALRTALEAVDRERSFESVGQVRNALALALPSRRVGEGGGLLRVSPDAQRVLHCTRWPGRLDLFTAEGTLLRSEEFEPRQLHRATWGFSPSGAFVAAEGEEGGLRLWSAADGRPLEVAGLPAEVGAHAWTAGDELVVGDADSGAVLTVDLARGAVTTVRPAGREPTTANLVVDDARVSVLLGTRQSLERWPLEGAADPDVLPVEHPPRRIDRSDRGLVAAALADGSLVFGDFESGVVSHAAKDAISVYASPAGSRLLSYHATGPARLWDGAGTLVEDLARPDDDSFPALAPGPMTGYFETSPFSPDGERVVTLYGDLTLCFWDREGQWIGFATGSPGTTDDTAQWSPDGLLLTYGTARRTQVLDRDGRLRHDLPRNIGIALGSGLWTAGGGALFVWDYAKLPLHAHPGTIRRVLCVGDRILTGGYDGTVRVFRGDGGLLREYGPIGERAHGFALSESARWVAVCGDRGRLRIWASGADEHAQEWKAPERSGGFLQVAFLGEDPPRIVATGYYEEAYLCELDRAEPELFPIGGTGGGVVVHDGVVTTLVRPSEGEDGTVLVWRPGAREPVLQRLSMAGRWGGADVAISRDGLALAAAAGNATLVWRRESVEDRWEEPARALIGHTEQIKGIGFSSGGTLLASCGEDGTARLWSVADGRCRAVLRGHEGAVRSGAFLPGDRELVTAGEDGYLRCYLVDDDEVLTKARALLEALEPR